MQQATALSTAFGGFERVGAICYGPVDLTWREAYRSALTRAQQQQMVLAAVDPSDVAHLLVAQIEGTP